MDGELEPHSRPVLANDPPARGEGIDEMQPEAACPAIGGTPADLAMAKVLDFDAHDAVHGARPDLHRRTRGLACMPDAVGHELGYEEAGVLTQLGVTLASSHRVTTVRARNGASGPDGTVASSTSTRLGR